MTASAVALDAVRSGVLLSVPPVASGAPKATPHPLSRREERLWQVAELHDLIVDFLRRTGVTGDGDAVGAVQTPREYDATVKEFERLMCVMRDNRAVPLQTLKTGEKISLRALWWHVNEWHIKAVRKIDWKPVVVKRGRKLHYVRTADGGIERMPERGVRRHRDSDLDKARAGIKWIADNWSLGHEPMVPKEVLEP